MHSEGVLKKINVVEASSSFVGMEKLLAHLDKQGAGEADKHRPAKWIRAWVREDRLEEIKALDSALNLEGKSFAFFIETHIPDEQTEALFQGVENAGEGLSEIERSLAKRKAARELIRACSENRQ